MHIAVIGSRGYPSTYGGFETFVRRFAPHAVDAGHRVTVYNRRSLGLRPDAGDPIEVVEVGGRETKAASTLTHGFAAFRHASGRDFDVALVLNVANGFFLPLLGRRGVSTVVNVDGLEWERRKWGPLARRVFWAGARATARWATDIVVDSRAIGDVWVERLGRDSTFIPYGADVEDRPADRVMDLGLEPGAYALVVARLAPENNVELALDAFERLGGKHQLVIVGDANYANPTVARIQGLQARSADRVQWLGHVDDQDLLADLWGNAGVYIHGHSAGGTNPALLQAMGYGAPVAAFNSVYNREVLGEAGTTFSTAQDLVDAWDDVMQGRPPRESAVQAARERLLANYQWHDVNARYLQLLERCAAGQEAP